MAYSVLIVDDEQIERKYINQILSKYPFEYVVVGEAQNGKQAIECAQSLVPDIIIMDIKIPIIDGLEASRIIKKHSEHTVIVMNSAYSEFDFAKKALQYDLDGYLLKPSTEQEIIQALDQGIRKLKAASLVSSTPQILNPDFSIYPYQEADAIMNALKLCDLELLDEGCASLLKSLDYTSIKVEQYHLFLINTFFSVLKKLDQMVPGESIAQNANRYFDQLLKARNKAELLVSVGDFLAFIKLQAKAASLAGSNLTRYIEHYLKDHFREAITLEELAEKFHFSPNHISRRFHSDQKITIIEFLRRLRMEHALNLLTHSTLSIHEIAKESGYPNVSHFNRVFKQYTGNRPSQYRKETD
ncbi:response regulator [Proteiniclasticum sp. QWL-01]|uniref:response regulator transcription factor n=1 Tax=Proteiniclasticum sp. QWL-01 TaxID=3036945 RepID=UPI0024108B9E|nr:response regulator [Proteiniclasticum sp. QWL-01]WFF71780.1 response regulator [Proteiniclasticum sp. QWL-01]